MSESSRVRSTLPLFGGLLACAACCSVPLFLPLLLSAGAGSALLGSAVLIGATVALFLGAASSFATRCR